MTQSLTERLQQTRFMVVDVDPARGRLRVKADACSDLACREQTVVVADDGSEAGLETLNPGDLVKVEGAPGRPDRIVVVRRAWEDLASPEL